MYSVSCYLHADQLLPELSASCKIFGRDGVLSPSSCYGFPSQRMQSIISLRFRTVECLHSRCQYRLDSESINKFLQIPYYRAPYKRAAARACVCMYVCIYIYIYIYIYVCMHVYVCVCVYIYIYIYILCDRVRNEYLREAVPKVIT